jgi:uncharacterized membrane protein
MIRTTKMYLNVSYIYLLVDNVLYPNSMELLINLIKLKKNESYLLATEM